MQTSRLLDVTPGLGRFRVTVARQRGTLGITVRQSLPSVPSLQDRLR